MAQWVLQGRAELSSRRRRRWQWLQAARPTKVAGRRVDGERVLPHVASALRCGRLHGQHAGQLPVPAAGPGQLPAAARRQALLQRGKVLAARHRRASEVRWHVPQLAAAARVVRGLRVHLGGVVASRRGAAAATA